MSLQTTIYIIASLISAATSLLLAIYAWRHRGAYGATAFGWMMALAAWWSVLGVLDLLTGNPLVASPWRNLKYIAIAGMPVTWLLFALEFTRQDWWLTPVRIATLCAMPILTQFVIWTNGWLHYLWYGSEGPQIWFWIHAAYSYLLILVGSVLMVVSILRAKQLRRAQAIVMLTGIAIPLVLNIAYTFGLLNMGMMDLTSIAFSITGVLFAWGMFGYRLFDLAPMAREMLIDSMQDGTIVFDLQNRIADINPAARAIVGTPFSGVIGRAADDVLPPLSDFNAPFKSWSALLHNRQLTRPLEIVRTTKNMDRSYEMDISTLYDHQNHIAGRLLVLHEITEQKKAARAIQAYARRLEQQNAELEASNAELDAFAHTVAHDLKTPLTTLIGFGALLKQRWPRMPAEQVTENLTIITQTGRKMTTIIEELLLLSSVRKQEEVETEPLKMSDIVNEALERFRHQIEESGATITVPEDWPTAIGYAPWIEEVWVNYISNALKYGGHPEEGIPTHVELGYDVDTETPSSVRFWIRDNGPGLTDEQREQLFTQFTRLHKVRAQGHGLGLSIVRRIVEKLDGDVGVESVTGAGCTFWFTLPLITLNQEPHSKLDNLLSGT